MQRQGSETGDGFTYGGWASSAVTGGSTPNINSSTANLNSQTPTINSGTASLNSQTPTINSGTASLGNATPTINSNSASITVNSNGSGGSQNIPPAIVLNYIIKT